MAQPSQRQIAKALLDRHGQTFAEELGIKVEQNTPAVLFRLLVASILYSTRISNEIASQAIRALFDHGWTTAEKMVAATWRQRTDVLNHAGYARYDESTSRMLDDTAALLQDRYKGDLRRLRDTAEHEPAEERKLLKQFKGLGDVGVDIFFREVQIAWPELMPFVDKKAAKSAEKLGLPTEPRELAKLVRRQDFPRLVAALVRADLAHDHEALRDAA